jgi:hypothetical protein
MRNTLLRVGGAAMLITGYVFLICSIGGILLVARFMPEEESALSLCFVLVTVAAFAWLLVASGKQMLRNELLNNTPESRRMAYGGCAVILLGVVGVVLSELRVGSTAGIGFALVVVPGVVGALFGMHMGAKRNARI